MKKHLSLLCAGIMAVEAIALSAVPAASAPLRTSPTVSSDQSGLVTEVQYRRRHYRGRGRDNAGAIIGGLAAGAIIGGIIASQRPRYYDYDEPRYQPRVYYEPRYRSNGLSAHQRWCMNRYRSYDVYSDTFQPYYGSRQLCYSPYNR